MELHFHRGIWIPLKNSVVLGILVWVLFVLDFWEKMMTPFSIFVNGHLTRGLFLFFYEHLEKKRKGEAIIVHYECLK